MGMNEMQHEDAQDEEEQTQTEQGVEEQANKVSEDLNGQQAEGTEAQTEEPSDDGELVVTIAGEEPEPDEADHHRAAPWVRELRKTNREQARKIRELESKMSAPEKQDQAIDLGEKPTLAGHDYDAEAFEASLEKWYEKKRQIDAMQEQAQAKERAAQAEWQGKMARYAAEKEKLKAPDFEDAEDTVAQMLNAAQQGIIIKGAKNPALVVLALGKNPKKAAELAKLEDPIEFAFAVANLEKDVTVTTRKPTTQPEKTVRTSGSTAGSVDSQLDKLRAEAEKTGNYSKVIAYKAQMRNK